MISGLPIWSEIQTKSNENGDGARQAVLILRLLGPERRVRGGNSRQQVVWKPPMAQSGHKFTLEIFEFFKFSSVF